MKYFGGFLAIVYFVAIWVAVGSMLSWVAGPLGSCVALVIGCAWGEPSFKRVWRWFEIPS